MRGIPTDEEAEFQKKGIIPAHAGNTELEGRYSAFR